MRRIVVTGLGLVTPVGHTVGQSWDSILAGRSGVSAIDIFDAGGFASRIGATIKEFDISPYMPPKEARKTDRFIHYGIAAAKQATRTVLESASPSGPASEVCPVSRMDTGAT